MDKLNSISYTYHYRNLDSTAIYARRALAIARNYDSGQAEAYNNLAFVSIAKMDYAKAKQQLDSVKKVSDNQIELLIADIQYMRLCQRQSQNKDFYRYRERAKRHIRRINEEKKSLSKHQRKRMVYAKSEYNIVESIYFYYVGLNNQTIKSLEGINPNGEIEQDTAQLLNYWTIVGTGQVITASTRKQINQAEFDYLMQCYLLAYRCQYNYWEAQALQGLSELLQSPSERKQLIQDNRPSMKYINTDDMPDSLLAGNLAQRALSIYVKYGDVYQIAGAYCTLAKCYFGIQDYRSAYICLRNALDKNKIINRAPDMVASIREHLCLVYSAINEKPLSDYNRNKYLDIQEQTRQDRQLEARAGQLSRTSRQLNVMIMAVVMMIFVVSLLLFVFAKMRRKSDKKSSIDALLVPLNEWKVANNKQIADNQDLYDNTKEKIRMARLHTSQNKIRNVEQRAKISLVNSITPFIDRIMNEIHSLLTKNEDKEIRQERYAYIGQLIDKINEYNIVLTKWIQLRQGELSLHIESFPLRQLFDIIKKGKMSFQLKGIDLVVCQCDDIVKADRALTLFMINTMADNARKFTPAGGMVKISAEATDSYVEIVVSDTGIGMSDEQKGRIFDNKAIRDNMEPAEANTVVSQGSPDVQRSHGFGLMNCKGIIDKYRKVSQIFSVCDIGVDSELGKGSRFHFRLPKGMARTLIVISVMAFNLLVSTKALPIKSRGGLVSTKSQPTTLAGSAARFADSAYFSNINGTYSRTLHFADSCIKYLNACYVENIYRARFSGAKASISRRENNQIVARKQSDESYIWNAKRKSGDLMVLYDNSARLPAELKWFNDSSRIDYSVILDIRNESAVAALALHQWDVYEYNNNAYIRLFRDVSADGTLANYVQVVQKSASDKNVAIIILVLLLVMILPAYYFLYYRYRLSYRFSIDIIRRINDILLSDSPTKLKLDKIDRAWRGNRLMPNVRLSKLEVVVRQIEETLMQSIESEKTQKASIELAGDELRRVELENDNLHICNNVLDNCLSTLKHETMYYPYRIRQLIDGTDENIQEIHDLVSYYKDLFSILSAQAMRQMITVKRRCSAVSIPRVCDVPILGDEDTLTYLFDTIRKLVGEGEYVKGASPRGDNYVTISVVAPGLDLTDEQCNQLFQPSTIDIRYLICCQIIRDIGESTNARGCGILAKRGDNGVINMEITLVRARERVSDIDRIQ